MCNCNQPNKNAVQQRQTIRQVATRQVPRIRAVPPLTPSVAGFCSLCGWAIKRVRFYDPFPRAIVDKMTCTNNGCKNHK